MTSGMICKTDNQERENEMTMQNKRCAWYGHDDGGGCDLTPEVRAIGADGLLMCRRHYAEARRIDNTLPAWDDAPRQTPGAWLADEDDRYGTGRTILHTAETCDDLRRMADLHNRIFAYLHGLDTRKPDAE